jgi:hypothetical protein
MFGPTIFGERGVAWPQMGGLVGKRENADLAKVTATTNVCFFGIYNYLRDKAIYDKNVKITSPLVGDLAGNIYFTYRVYGDTPIHLRSGIVRIKPDGTSVYKYADKAVGDLDFTNPKLNSAPAISGDNLYVPIRRSNGSDGYLVCLDAKTLVPKSKVYLLDPKSGNPAHVDEDGTACPVVAPNGDVYFGVLGNPDPNHYRGWLLHFSPNLSETKTPGAFGWDDTPSIVPSALVPSYQGTSTYLLLCKYNNYVQGGGDGVNRIAILDPNGSEVEVISGIATMPPVMSIAGPTPDTEYLDNHPNAVREWCVNTAAIDTIGGYAILNCEDGFVYRWQFSTGLLSGKRLTDGIGEAYTSTIIGAHGQVIAMNNARIYALGK